MRQQRGFTFVTFLVLLAGIGAVGWIVTFGPAYWDNVQVNRTLNEAANMCYRQHDDEVVRRWVWQELHHQFDTEERGDDGLPAMAIDVQPEDFRIERIDEPKRWVHVWLTYHRTVQVPLINRQREVTFVDHAEQDLSPVKW